MTVIEAKLAELGLELPSPPEPDRQLPAGDAQRPYHVGNTCGLPSGGWRPHIRQAWGRPHHHGTLLILGITGEGMCGPRTDFLILNSFTREPMSNNHHQEGERVRQSQICWSRSYPMSRLASASASVKPESVRSRWLMAWARQPREPNAPLASDRLRY